jgi:hypothetical protein
VLLPNRILHLFGPTLGLLCTCDTHLTCRPASGFAKLKLPPAAGTERCQLGFLSPLPSVASRVKSPARRGSIVGRP